MNFRLSCILLLLALAFAVPTHAQSGIALSPGCNTVSCEPVIIENLSIPYEVTFRVYNYDSLEKPFKFSVEGGLAEYATITHATARLPQHQGSNCVDSPGCKEVQVMFNLSSLNQEFDNGTYQTFFIAQTTASGDEMLIINQVLKGKILLEIPYRNFGQEARQARIAAIMVWVKRVLIGAFILLLLLLLQRFRSAHWDAFIGEKEGTNRVKVMMFTKKSIIPRTIRGTGFIMRVQQVKSVKLHGVARLAHTLHIEHPKNLSELVHALLKERSAIEYKGYVIVLLGSEIAQGDRLTWEFYGREADALLSTYLSCKAYHATTLDASKEKLNDHEKILKELSRLSSELSGQPRQRLKFAQQIFKQLVNDDLAEQERKKKQTLEQLKKEYEKAKKGIA